MGGGVRINEFVAGLMVILDGTEEERLDFAFNGLDTDGDGVITQDEFLAFFKHYFVAKSEVEHSRKLPEQRWHVIERHLRRTFRGTDANNDGTVDVKEFTNSIRSDPDHPFSLILDSFHTLSDSVACKSPARRAL